jgi:hypothetical protein
MASKKLAQLARVAAKANGKAAAAHAAWVDAFQAAYGHDDISDILVSAIDYSIGNAEVLTPEFIEAHSAPGQS